MLRNGRMLETIADDLMFIPIGTTWVTNMMKRMQEGRAQEREIDMLQELVSLLFRFAGLIVRL